MSSKGDWYTSWPSKRMPWPDKDWPDLDLWDKGDFLYQTKSISFDAAGRKGHNGALISALVTFWQSYTKNQNPTFVIDLTYEVTGSPEILNLDINLCVPWWPTCSIFSRSSCSIRGETAREGVRRALEFKSSVQCSGYCVIVYTWLYA